MIDVDVGTVHRGEEFRAAVVETHETVNGEGLLSTSSNTGTLERTRPCSVISLAPTA